MGQLHEIRRALAQQDHRFDKQDTRLDDIDAKVDKITIAQAEAKAARAAIDNVTEKVGKAVIAGVTVVGTVAAFVVNWPAIKKLFND